MKKSEMNFEAKLEQLEALALRIKEDNVPLDEAFTIFEQGMKLAKTLEAELGKLEGRVEILINQPLDKNEKPKLELFDGEE